MRILSDKMDFEIEDISCDIKAYEASLQHLEQESYSILSEMDFLKEKKKVSVPLGIYDLIRTNEDTGSIYYCLIGIFDE